MTIYIFVVIFLIAYDRLSDKRENSMIKEEKEIERIKNKITKLGAIHPGSISEQYTVCGKKGCKCKDKENPKKHGPYHQLSYTIRGKSSSIFIKKENLKEARKRIKDYKMFKELCVELTRAYVELAKKTGFVSNHK